MAEKRNPSPLEDILRKLNGNAEAALEVQLPQGGEHYYYSNFPAYREPLKEGLATIQQLLTTCESMVRTRRALPPDWTDADEVAAWSSELLDDVVERMDGALDAERARLRGREAGPRRQLEAGGAAAAANADSSLLANLPSFGGIPVRPSRPKDMVRHATGLARPQERFDPRPDNRREVPFRPRVDHLAGLTAEPCDPRVYQPAPGAPEDYPHPFAANLEALTYRPDQLAPPAQPPQPPPEPEDTPLVWVDGEEALAGLVSELSTAEEVAVDLEHHSHRSFQGFTCLMQISTRATDYVVDTLALRNQLGPALARVFADPRVVKVLHGADSDVEWLQRDFGLFPVNLFDTGQAARVLGLASCGLAHIMESICGVTPDKRYQMADWRVRPLSPEMMHYARCDTHYLLYMYDKLRQQLAAVPDDKIPASLAVALPPSNPGGALGLVLERSRQLCLKTYRKPGFSPTGYQELLLRWQLNLSPQQASVFAALLAWRDAVCRSEDEGTGYVLSKAQLVALAQAMPEDAKRVQAVLGRAMSEVATRRIGELVTAINEAKHRPIQPPPAAAPASAPAGATTGAAAGAAAAPPPAAAAAAGAVAPRAALPALKPRAVAPIRTAAKPGTAALAAAIAPAPGGGSAAAAAAEEKGAGTAAEGPPSRQGMGAGGGRSEADEKEAAEAGTSGQGTVCSADDGAASEGAAAVVPAAAAPAPAATSAAASGLKARALKPPPIKPAVSRSAAMFGGGAANSVSAAAAVQPEAAAAAPPSEPQNGEGSAGASGEAEVAAAAAPPPSQRPAAAAVRRVQVPGGGGGGTSLLGTIFGGGAGASGTAGGARPAAQQPVCGGGGGAAASRPAAGDGEDGEDGLDEEERRARQRAKRLRTTFALPFMAAPAAPPPSAGATDGVAAAPSGATAPAAPAGRAKPSATAADIRAAVEALRAEGEGTEIVIDADGQGPVVPPGESARGGGGSGSGAAPPAGGHEAPQARTVAETDSDADDGDGGGGDAAAAAAGTSGAGEGAQQRVAGSDLGLDVLDYVPVPLSQMTRKNKGGKGDMKRREQGQSGGGPNGNGGGGGGGGPKRRRFTTEVPAIAGGAAAEQHDGDSSSDGGDGSDSDGGHTVGPFAKKRPQKPPKKLQKLQQNLEQQAQAQPGNARKAGRRGGKPEPKGLMADFPRTNLVPAAPEGRNGGRGGRGGRDGGRGGRGGGRGGAGGRQPTAFNPYDIPDEFLLKGGKRSAVMPRSGNRSHTFK